MHYSKTPSINKDVAARKLNTFMEKYRNKTKAKLGRGEKLEWTHAVMCGYKGSFNIPEDKYNEFVKLYRDALFTGNKLHITERHRQQGPIVIDIDFVHEKKGRKYTRKTIEDIVTTYNKIIKKYVVVKKKDMLAYVSEKKNPVKRNGAYHDGIHIVYPYVCTEPKLQMLFRDDFIKEAETNKYFDGIATNSIEDIVDKNVIYQTSWSLYGSTKNAESLPYLTTSIYMPYSGKICDIVSPGEDPLSYSNITHYVDKLSCRRFFNPATVAKLKNNISHIDVSNRCNKLRKKQQALSDENKSPENIVLDAINNQDDFDIFGDINRADGETRKEAAELCKLLSVERATAYGTWYQVGRCLFSIDVRLIDSWLEFSQKCPEKYNKEECTRVWSKMTPGKYTIATLHYLAKSDSPKEYDDMSARNCEKNMADLRVTHTSIAKLLLDRNKHEFVCASVDKKIWYQYCGNKWELTECGVTLRNRIDTQIVGALKKKKTDMFRNYDEADGIDIIKETKIITDIINKLEDSTFKEKVMTECRFIAHDKNFLNKLDENINLLGFTNGVYELDTGEFRKGLPDDYISLNTGYDYVVIDDDDESMIQVMNFFNKIHSSDEMRNYILTLLSTCLSGSISEEDFYILTGSGANGKSKLIELMKEVLGELFKPLDVRVLTVKRGSASGATPELVDKKGIRLCSLDEPDANDHINTGFMKLFTGGEMMMARALYSNCVYFKPQFKPFLLCNKMPSMKDDGGTWRRIKAIEFPNKFIKKSLATKRQLERGLPEGHFWAEDLEGKFSEWKQAFVCVLLKYYKKYQQVGLIHPKCVTKFTEDYRRRCDIFMDFLDDHVEKTNKPTDTVDCSNLYAQMRIWHRENYGGSVPPKKELVDYLNDRIDGYRKGVLYGFKIKELHDELDGLDGFNDA